jgi:hypothetical protein
MLELLFQAFDIQEVSVKADEDKESQENSQHFALILTGWSGLRD